MYMPKFTLTYKKQQNPSSIKFEEGFEHDYYGTMLHCSALAYESPIVLVETLSHTNCQHLTIYDTHGSQAFLAVFEKHAVVSFRGTERDNIIDIRSSFNFLQKKFNGAKVHSGYLTCMEDISYRILNDMKMVSGKRIHFTGHSMGGAMAMLMSFEYLPYAITTFGSPKVGGGEAFCNHLAKVPVVNSFSIRGDLITHLPPSIPLLVKYEHPECCKSITLETVGKKLSLKHRHSLRAYRDGLAKYRSSINNSS